MLSCLRRPNPQSKSYLTGSSVELAIGMFSVRFDAVSAASVPCALITGFFKMATAAWFPATTAIRTVWIDDFQRSRFGS